MRPLRIFGGLLLAVVSGVMPGRVVCAQTPGVFSSGGTQSQGPAPMPQGDASGESVKSEGVESEVPDSPGQKIVDGGAKGNVVGSVLDANGAEVEGAVVKVENEDSKAQQTSTTDGSGAFQFFAVEPGRLRVTVTRAGVR